jgi:hypothetical protein
MRQVYHGATLRRFRTRASSTENGSVMHIEIICARL